MIVSVEHSFVTRFRGFENKWFILIIFNKIPMKWLETSKHEQYNNHDVTCLSLKWHSLKRKFFFFSFDLYSLKTNAFYWTKKIKRHNIWSLFAPTHKNTPISSLRGLSQLRGNISFCPGNFCVFFKALEILQAEAHENLHVTLN